MEIAPHIFSANVMHKRFIPKINKFTYKVYYLAFPLSQEAALEDGWRFGLNKPGVLSFYDVDHGAKDGSNMQEWVRSILKKHKVNRANGEIILVSMPRVFGYVFNPVSFWLCLDKKHQLRAVLCEVNNTFGETHTYLCVQKNQKVITKDDWLEAEKIFHVSPFLEREGRYRFRFSYGKKSLGIWIDYYNADDKKQLATSLIGKLKPYNRKTRSEAFRSHPLVTLKTIALIHWQAIKLFFKGIKYVIKPMQKDTKLTKTKHLTKM